MAQKTLATKGHLTKLPSFMFRSVYFSNLKQVCRSSGKHLAAACKAAMLNVCDVLYIKLVHCKIYGISDFNMDNS